MSGKFKQAYAELMNFLAAHPEIEIGDYVTSIPEDVRPDFYSFFNNAREAYIAEKFPECVTSGFQLKQQYDRALEGVSCLHFEEGPLASKCWRFLNNPTTALARELFDPLFDLLKKRLTFEDFQQRVAKEIETLFPVIHRSGFEKWVIASLANLLDVQKALRVPVRDLRPGDKIKPPSIAPMEEVPAPVESSSFCFTQSPRAIFSAPDFILYSDRLKLHVGVRSDFREGLYHASNISTERAWIPIDTDLLMLLDLGLTLLYLSEKAENIALVADISRLCRPDMILWCLDSRHTTKWEALEKMDAIQKRLQPDRGAFIITNEPWLGAEETEELEAVNAPECCGYAGTRILATGFDRNKLKPVVEALSDTLAKAKANA